MKTENIILIIMIFIIILIICHKYKRINEGFTEDAVQLFNVDNLKEVNTKLTDETEKLNTIITKMRALNDRTKENILGDRTTVLAPLMDTAKLTKLNNEITDRVQNTNLTKHYQKTKKQVRDHRQHAVDTTLKNDQVVKQKVDSTKELTGIKHYSSAIFDLTNVKPGTTNNKKYQIKSKQDCSGSKQCLSFTDDSIKQTTCDVEDNSQYFNINEIKSEYKCYDMENEKFVVEEENCDENINTYLKQDTSTFTDKYNELVPPELYITKDNTFNQSLLITDIIRGRYYLIPANNMEFYRCYWSLYQS
jgi:hypothetical protein